MEITGTLTELVQRTTKNGKPIFFVNVGDVKASGWPEQVTGVDEGDKVRLVYEQNGEYKNIKSLIRLDGAEAPFPDVPSPDFSETAAPSLNDKELSIVTQSILRSAAIYTQQSNQKWEDVADKMFDWYMEKTQ